MQLLLAKFLVKRLNQKPVLCHAMTETGNWEEVSSQLSKRESKCIKEGKHK